MLQQLTAYCKAQPSTTRWCCCLCCCTPTCRAVLPHRFAVLQAAALRAVQQGHDIGSHAAQHLDLTKLTPAEIEQQIAWGSLNISSLTGSSIVPVSVQACRTTRVQSH
jgi:hypothetical protein